MAEEINSDRKRPILVWVILLFIVFSGGFGTLSIILVHSGTVPMEPEAQAYFDQLTLLDHFLTITLGILNIIGAILLFRLKSLSCYIFSAAFLVNALMHIWHILNKGWIEAVASMEGYTGAYYGLGIALLIVGYSWFLKSRRVLT